MTLASALRFTPVTLSGDAQPFDLTSFFQSMPPPAQHIACRAGTAGERNLTAALIDDAVTQTERTVLLLAQGVGCAAVAWWARLSPRFYVERVSGALLIDPDGGTTASSDFASPRSTLPFPSMVVGNDESARRLSSEWGSRLLDPLPSRLPNRRGTSLRTAVLRFTAGIIEKDVSRAERLLQATSGRRTDGSF